MRYRTFAAVASVGGGLGVAAAVAAVAVTGEARGALPPPPTVTLTTPIATATVGVPEPPPSPVPPPTAPTPTSPSPLALPPPPALPTEPATETVAAATRTATGGSTSPGASSSGASPASGVAGGSAPATGGEPGGTSTRVGRGPARGERTLRARPVPGRPGSRRLVLTLKRPRELTILFRGPGDTCRVAGTITIQGRRGANVVPLDGRVRGGRLGAGVFRVDVLDTSGSAERRLGRLAVSLRYDAQGRARVRQVPLAARACLGARMAVPALPVVGERTMPPRGAETTAASSQTGRVAGTSPAPGGGGPGATEPEGDAAGVAALPFLGPDDAVDGLTLWVLVTLLVLSAGGFVAVAGTSAVRALRR